MKLRKSLPFLGAILLASLLFLPEISNAQTATKSACGRAYQKIKNAANNMIASPVCSFTSLNGLVDMECYLIVDPIHRSDEQALDEAVSPLPHVNKDLAECVTGPKTTAWPPMCVKASDIPKKLENLYSYFQTYGYAPDEKTLYDPTDPININDPSNVYYRSFPTADVRMEQYMDPIPYFACPQHSPNCWSVLRMIGGWPNCVENINLKNGMPIVCVHTKINRYENACY